MPNPVVFSKIKPVSTALKLLRGNAQKNSSSPQMSEERMSTERPEVLAKLKQNTSPTRSSAPTYSQNAAGVTTVSTDKKTTPPPERMETGGVMGEIQRQNQEADARLAALRNAQRTEPSTNQPMNQVTPSVQAGGVPSDTQTALKSLRERYTGTLAPSEQERALQDELEQFRQSARLGISGLEGQGRGIPLNLIRGQQSQLAKQAGIQEQTLLQRIANAQAARQAEQQAALTELGFAREDLAAEQTANQPIKIGDALVQYNPATGQYEEVYKAPLSADPITLSEGQIVIDPNTGQVIGYNPKDRAPISVSPGQTIIDPNTGEVLFQAGERPQDLPTSIQEYLFATGQGYTGDFNSFKNQKTGSNLPVSVATDIANTRNLLNLIQRIPESGGIPGTGATGRLPGILLSEEGQNVRYTLNNILAQIAKLRGGTSFTPNEQALLESYTPKPEDFDYDIRGKLRNLKIFLEGHIEQLESIYGPQGASSNQSSSDQQKSAFEQLNPGDSYEEALQELGPEGMRQYLQSQGFTNDLSTSQNGSMQSFKDAIARQESGGRYNAIGPVTAKGNRAYGKYQVMDFNIPSWTKEALGYSMTPQQFLNNPEAQEAVADYKFQNLYNQYGNWGDVASVWFSGRPLAKAGNASDVTGTTVPRYVQNILSFMG